MSKYFDQLLVTNYFFINFSFYLYISVKHFFPFRLGRRYNIFAREGAKAMRKDGGLRTHPTKSTARMAVAQLRYPDMQPS